MNRKLFVLITAMSLITSMLMSLSYRAAAQTNEIPLNGCMSYETLQYLMDDLRMELLSRGKQADNRWLEIWTDFDDRHIIIVEFDSPSSENGFKIQKACVTKSTKDTTFKVRSMRIMIRWFNKLTTED